MASMICAVPMVAAPVRATVRVSATRQAVSMAGVPVLPVRPAGLKLRARKAAVAVRAQAGDSAPRRNNSLIVDIAAGRAPAQERNNNAGIVEAVQAAVQGLWGMRRGIACAAFAVVLALADPLQAMAAKGRGGGGGSSRTAGRMGGSSFQAKKAAPAAAAPAAAAPAAAPAVGFGMPSIMIMPSFGMPFGGMGMGMGMPMMGGGMMMGPGYMMFSAIKTLLLIVLLVVLIRAVTGAGNNNKAQGA